MDSCPLELGKRLSSSFQQRLLSAFGGILNLSFMGATRSENFTSIEGRLVSWQLCQLLLSNSWKHSFLPLLRWSKIILKIFWFQQNNRKYLGLGFTSSFSFCCHCSLKTDWKTNIFNFNTFHSDTLKRVEFDSVQISVRIRTNLVHQVRFYQLTPWISCFIKNF